MAIIQDKMMEAGSKVMAVEVNRDTGRSGLKALGN